jgi:hypothetical protein
MTEIEGCWIDEIPEDSKDWIIPGFICPTLNLWSGQPKMGKSMLVGHALYALANNLEFLGSKTPKNDFLFGWMGFDPGWKQELRERWGLKLKQKLRVYQPIRNLNQSDWLRLAQKLKNDGVSVFVIDHLYGMSGSLDLNDANEVYKVYELIRPIYDDFGIAVILLHQAGKSYFSEGRAANSMSIEAEARNLVRIYGKKSPNLRTINLSSNQGDEEILRIALDLEICELSSNSFGREKRSYERDSPERVSKFLDLANSKELSRGWKGAGRELARLKYSISADAGRKMASTWGEQGLLAKTEVNRVVPGPILLAWLSNKATNVQSD